MTGANALLQFTNLTLGYDRHPAVHHLNASIQSGEFLAIVGPNGGGKSTLLKALAGHIKPLSGEIDFSQTTPAEIAYLPQQATIDLTFPVRVSDLVAMGLLRETGMFSAVGKQGKDAINTALDKVEMVDFADHPVQALSGGQIQRVLFARMLVQKANLILLDEPFSALDSTTTNHLIRLLATLNQAGAAIVAVLHDMRLVKTHFPTTLLLARELIAHGSTAEIFTPDNLLKAQQMQESFDALAQVCKLELKKSA